MGNTPPAGLEPVIFGLEVRALSIRPRRLAYPSAAINQSPGCWRVDTATCGSLPSVPLASYFWRWWPGRPKRGHLETNYDVGRWLPAK